MRLKEIRQSMNLTQREVAEHLGCNSNIYSRYETGERQPSIEVLIKLSEFFGVSIDYIVKNHAAVAESLSEYEKKLLAAARGADKRAKDDALYLLLRNQMEKDK